MNLPVILFLICFFKMTVGATPTYKDYFVIRNVGQGLWTTHITNEVCEHYDFGGEIFLAQKIKKRLISQCYNKLNVLHLSHAHLDHYAFLEMILNNTKSVCWATRPPEAIAKEPAEIPSCSGFGHILFYDMSPLNKNDRSIVQIMNTFLIPGDSSMKMEKLWVPRLKLLKAPIKYLLLGHHGSRTATGDALLNQLPDLKMAIASSRFQKFRHPHSETTKKLREHKVPLIKTEDWGDIRIDY